MSMIHLLALAVHLLATIAKLMRPGGVRAVVAEFLLLKQQLLISSRARRRAPNLNSFDRFLLGLGSLFVPASRIPKLAVILKPRTLFRFHEALKKRKYRWLFSSGGHRRPGPKGPSKELIDAIVEFKRCAFSASSRLLDLKGEATRFKKRNISATIAAEVKRFCLQIKRTRFSVHTAPEIAKSNDRPSNYGPVS